MLFSGRWYSCALVENRFQSGLDPVWLAQACWVSLQARLHLFTFLMHMRRADDLSTDPWQLQEQFVTRSGPGSRSRDSCPCGSSRGRISQVVHPSALVAPISCSAYWSRKRVHAFTWIPAKWSYRWQVPFGWQILQLFTPESQRNPACYESATCRLKTERRSSNTCFISNDLASKSRCLTRSFHSPGPNLLACMLAANCQTIVLWCDGLIKLMPSMITIMMGSL